MASQLVLGFDIGGTKCATALARLDGQLLARQETPTGQRPWQEVLQELADRGRDLLRQELVSIENLRGIGVSCGGPLDTKTGTIYTPPNLPEWKDVPARAFFEAQFALPVRLENDANATALAEWRFGAGQGVQNLVFLTMGTGIGGGLILDGSLYRGTNDLAGELGHQTILLNGPRCGCGKRGCLEALASGPAIARLARESLRYGRHKRVLALAGGNPQAITAKHVIEAAQAGDSFAVQILEEAGTYMGVGIANLIQLLNPERVVIGTIAVHAGDLILEPIRRAVSEYAWPRSASVCEIVPAALGDRAQDLAAIALWVN